MRSRSIRRSTASVRAIIPTSPYADGRVIVHLDDGRNYLRSTTKQYDLIIYALVDSLVLHSSYSNIRLESYLFTTEAFADIRKRLRPGGMFVMYNYFRQGWIVDRLQGMLEATFGAGNPIVFNLPTRSTVSPDDVLTDAFTMMFAGGTAPIKEAFARRPEFWLGRDRPSDRLTPNGFEMSDSHARAEWARSEGNGGPEVDDVWPDDGCAARLGAAPADRCLAVPVFTRPDDSGAEPARHGHHGYPRRPAHPAVHSAPGGGARARQDPGFRLLAQMFCLGAGFMLIETKAVVQMALLFGSTWMVNSIVFCAVLVMILLANLFVLAVRPRSQMPFYIGLAVSLAASAVVPLDAFLGLSRTLQIAGSCALAFTPVLFAGVVFAISFGQAVDADRAFGANVAGAMVGGLAEYSSMLLGFQYVVLVALGFYLISAINARTAGRLAGLAAALKRVRRSQWFTARARSRGSRLHRFSPAPLS